MILRRLQTTQQRCCMYVFSYIEECSRWSQVGLCRCTWARVIYPHHNTTWLKMFRKCSFYTIKSYIKSRKLCTSIKIPYSRLLWPFFNFFMHQFYKHYNAKSCIAAVLTNLSYFIKSDDYQQVQDKMLIADDCGCSLVVCVTKP